MFPFILKILFAADGDQVLVPDTIDSLVINDENGEIMKIPLTDRQRKKMEDRLNTFSERVKRQKEKAKLKTLFDPPMKQVRKYDQFYISLIAHLYLVFILESVIGSI